MNFSYSSDRYESDRPVAPVEMPDLEDDDDIYWYLDSIGISDNSQKVYYLIEEWGYTLCRANEIVNSLCTCEKCDREYVEGSGKDYNEIEFSDYEQLIADIAIEQGKMLLYCDYIK